MNNSTDLDEQIRSLIPLLDELERSLETEAEALATRDPEALLTAVDAKRRSLREFEIALSRTMLVEKLKTPVSGSAAETTSISSRLPRQVAPSASAGNAGVSESTSWQDFRDRLVKCRNLNYAAGGTTAMLQRNNAEGLRLLGMSPDPSIYGLNGSAKAALRTLKSVVA